MVLGVEFAGPTVALKRVLKGQVSLWLRWSDSVFARVVCLFFCLECSAWKQTCGTRTTYSAVVNTDCREKYTEEFLWPAHCLLQEYFWKQKLIFHDPKCLTTRILLRPTPCLPPSPSWGHSSLSTRAGAILWVMLPGSTEQGGGLTGRLAVTAELLVKNLIGFLEN